MEFHIEKKKSLCEFFLLLNVVTVSFLTLRQHKPDVSQERGEHN